MPRGEQPPQSGWGGRSDRRRSYRREQPDKRWLDEFKEKLPESKPYFKDKEGNPCLHTDFVSKEVLDPFAEGLVNKTRHSLTTGQIRRFFSHCRDIERRLEVDNESWEQVAADFERLSCHAQYAGSKIPPEFQQFIDDNIRRVKSSDNQGAAFLNGFMPHFEALVGFGSKYMKDRKGG